jgi:hypothetical protein
MEEVGLRGAKALYMDEHVLIRIGLRNSYVLSLVCAGSLESKRSAVVPMVLGNKAECDISML